MPLTVVIKESGWLMVGVIEPGPEINVQEGGLVDTFPLALPVRTEEEPQIVALPPAFTVQSLIPCPKLGLTNPKLNSTTAQILEVNLVMSFSLNINEQLYYS